MSSLILVVGYLGFSYKQVPCLASPDPSALPPVRRLSFFALRAASSSLLPLQLQKHVSPCPAYLESLRRRFTTGERANRKNLNVVS
jgi:hypothetical protein